MASYRKSAAPILEGSKATDASLGSKNLASAENSAQNHKHQTQPMSRGGKIP